MEKGTSKEDVCMSEANPQTSTSISGVAVSAAFAIVGLLVLLVWPDAYLSATIWLGAIFVLFGVVGFLIELSKLPSVKKYRFDSLGVGFVLLAPAFFSVQFIYVANWNQWLKMSLITVLLAFILFGVCGIVDFLISIFESKNNFRQSLVYSLKFLSVVLPAIAAILVAAVKLINELK